MDKDELNELLLAISNLIDVKLRPLKEDIQDIKALQENEILPRLKMVEVTQENAVLPQLSAIQSCYIDTYKRYEKDAREIEGALFGIDLVKKAIRVVQKHNEDIPKLDNWIIDIYTRIDADDRIPVVRHNQYRDEIHWCYRLGYMTHDEYCQTLEYLDTRAEWKNSEAERLHAVRMAQIQYEQRLVADRAKEEAEIRDLFQKHVRFDKHVGLYYYGD